MCVEIIKNIVEKEFNVQIIRKSRRRQYIEARAMYYKLLLDKKNMSLTSIAKTVNKTHATALNGIKRINDWMETDRNLFNVYETLEDKVDAMIKKFPKKFNKTKTEKELYIKEYEDLELKYKALKGRHHLLLNEIERITPNYYIYYKRFKELETNNI